MKVTVNQNDNVKKLCDVVQMNSVEWNKIAYILIANLHKKSVFIPVNFSG